MPAIFTRANLPLFPAAIFLFFVPFSGFGGLRLTMLVLSAVLVWLDRKVLQIPTIPLRLPLGLWAIVALISVIWALNPRYSLQEVRIEVGYGIATFLVFFSLTRGQTEYWLWIRVLVANLIVMLGIALSHFFQTERVFSDGQHGDIGRFSTYLIIMLAPVLMLAVRKPLRDLPANPAWLLIPLIFLGGYLTANRMFWIAAIFTIAVFTTLYVARHAQRRRIMKHATLTFGVCVILVSWLYIDVAQHRSVTLIAESANQVTSTADDPRLEIWQYAIHEIAKHPLTGVGFGRAADQTAFKTISPSGFIWHAHNLFLDYTLQMGIWGLLAIAFLFAAIGREFWRLYRSGDEACSLVGAAGLSLLAGMLLKNMTDDFFLRQNALLFWSLAGAALGYGHRQSQVNRDG